MSKAARSVQVFGVYLIGTALVLITAPNVLLGLLRIAPATEPWIRVLGVVVAVLGAYYVAAARAELVPFLRATVWGRAMALVGFVCLAALSWAPPMIVAFGVVDALGALWTWSALRSPGKAA